MYNLSLNLKLKETEKTEVCRQTYTFRYLRYTDIIFDLSEFELPKLNCIHWVLIWKENFLQWCRYELSVTVAGDGKIWVVYEPIIKENIISKLTRVKSEPAFSITFHPASNCL